MNGINSFDAASLRLLAERINRELREHADNLANGTAVVANDPMATGMNYLGAKEYTRALNNVLDWCSEVQDKLRRG